MSTSADKGSSNIDKCPVDHNSRAKWMEISQSQTNQKTEQNASDSSEIKKCPVDHHSAETKKIFTTPIKRPEVDTSSNSHLNPDNLMYSADAVQHPHPDQKIPLSQDREVSSIPRADQGNWIYPSEQMFFNAMKRKDWSPREGDMGVVVPIHNAVNEMAWYKILEWEKLHER
jgi:cytochrome c heme-lyase